MPSVLIADDAAFMRMMLKNVLTEAGYEVVGEAENGAVAVSKYRELNPDLPAGLERAVIKCLEHDRDKRYPITSVLVHDLKSALYV